MVNLICTVCLHFATLPDNLCSIFQRIKQILIDAVVHAVNEDCSKMANDFTRLGFLATGTDVAPIIPALEATWQNSFGNELSGFDFRTVTGKLYAPQSMFHVFL